MDVMENCTLFMQFEYSPILSFSSFSFHFQVATVRSDNRRSQIVCLFLSDFYLLSLAVPDVLKLNTTCSFQAPFQLIFANLTLIPSTRHRMVRRFINQRRQKAWSITDSSSKFAFSLSMELPQVFIHMSLSSRAPRL